MIYPVNKNTWTGEETNGQKYVFRNPGPEILKKSRPMPYFSHKLKKDGNSSLINNIKLIQLSIRDDMTKSFFRNFVESSRHESTNT